MVRLGETLSVGVGFLCWTYFIPLRLPWSESSSQTSLSTPMIPTLLWEVGYEWWVHHYSFSSGCYSWGTGGPASCLPIWWVSAPWWHYVIYYWYFYSVGFRSSDHLSRADQDSLSFLLDFLSFHLAYLSSTHHSFGEMCIFVCPCFWCSYELSSSFYSFFDWGS